MERKKEIVFISHCILNQNTVVSPLARSEGAYIDIVDLIIKKGIGIHQLACPEFRMLGIHREPMTKDEYDSEEYRKLCRDISLDTISILKEYKEKNYKLLALIGINNSPTCSIKNEKGILMEELISLLEENNLEIPFIDVPTNYQDGERDKKFIKELDCFLEEI